MEDIPSHMGINYSNYLTIKGRAKVNPGIKYNLKPLRIPINENYSSDNLEGLHITTQYHHYLQRKIIIPLTSREGYFNKFLIL
jgi:hypothetical protein